MTVERVQFDRVSKRYAVGARTTAREVVVQAARRLTGARVPRAPEVWSLRDVSFSVGEGEAVGVVGRNGAGKSTLLKVVTGITSPTTGVCRTRGRVAALLEVGTGFHPELTGRENVYLNGAILGMSRRDIARSFDAIVDFSGVERFLDTPVKHYSSGMGLRLGFSVAAHLEPDVLVVDEVLAVGDAEFQRKCLGRMEEVEQEGRTVVFVSHDLGSLVQVCSRAVWLDGGAVVGEGGAEDVVRRYLASTAPSAGSSLVLQGGPVTVRGVRVEGRRGGQSLLRDDPLRVEVDLELERGIAGFDLALYVTTAAGARVLDQALSDASSVLSLRAGRYRASMDLPALLNVGTHSVGVWCGTSTEDFVDEPRAASFTLHGSDAGRPARVVVLDAPVRLAPAPEPARVPPRAPASPPGQ